MEPEFIPCMPKFLENGLLMDAARVAIEQNPANRPAVEQSGVSGMVLPPEHLAVLTSKWWGNKGVRLTVGFLEQTPGDLQQRILMQMNRWNQYGNVSFVMASDPQVRITRAGDGYWSYLGTDILTIPRGQPTMCLQAFTMQTPDSEFRRVIPHEAGHTLGFPHEHMRRAIIQRIDPEKAIAYFRQTQGWSAAMVQSQVLTPLAEASIMATPDADEASIMTYSLPGIITRDGRPIIGGKDIEEQDAAFVGKIYPKAPAPPPPPVASGLDLAMDFDRKIVSLRLPAGWTVTKKSSTSEETMNFSTLASELEESVAKATEAGSGRQAAPGGVISAVLALVAALRVGDVKAIAVALRDLLNVLLGDGGGTDINFQQAAIAAGINWSRLIGILVRLLPLILGG
jgi:hypothetical protein